MPTQEPLRKGFTARLPHLFCSVQRNNYGLGE